MSSISKRVTVPEREPVYIEKYRENPSAVSTAASCLNLVSLLS